MKPRCEWCNRRIKAKPLGRPARFCSASCRQLAYARRQLAKRKQAEADAHNAGLGWMTHLYVKPKLPPRRRPRRVRCPVCTSPIVVKKRGPIPKTCSPRCALTLALQDAYRRGTEQGLTLLKKDMTALTFRAQRRRRHQTIIDDLIK